MRTPHPLPPPRGRVPQPGPGRRLKTIQFLGAALAMTAAAGCGGSGMAEPARKAPADTPAAATVVGVTKPKYEALSKEIVLSGEFRPYQVVDLHAKVAGYVKTITVDVGSLVRTNQEIASLEIPELEADLAMATAERRRREAEVNHAQAELERAAAQRELAQVSLERLQSASKAEPGIVAQQEIDEARARMRATQAQWTASKAASEVSERQVSTAKAAEHRADTMWRYRTITAPFDGVVTKRFADPGAMIQAGTASQTQAMPLVRLAEIRRLRLAVSVPESVVPMVGAGTAVEVRVGALNRTFSGRVARWTREVASNSRTMEAEIDVMNPDLKFAPGMFADVVLQVSRKDRGLTVPVTAVSNSGGNRSVMVVEGGRIAERAITTGIESAASLEVLSGVNEGDLVVVSNRGMLKPGQHVEARAVAGE